jgi:hypothetical protein
MVRTILSYAIFGTLGVMLGVTAVDMMIGSESTIGRLLWQLF